MRLTFHLASAAVQASEPIDIGRPVRSIRCALSLRLASSPFQKVSAEMPSTSRSGSQDMAESTASSCAASINSISRLKSASLLSGMLGMTMRLMWLVTPTGRIASNSGWTEVFVEGMRTANFLRNPSESVMTVSEKALDF